MSDTDRLRRLEAAEEIRHLKAVYCELCDDGYDADALVALFTADGMWDGGPLGRFEGHDALRAFFDGLAQSLPFAIHHVTNPVVTVADDATSAHGRWYLLQAATLAAGNRAVWLAGRYHDRFVLVDGAWRFAAITIRTRFFTPYEAGWAEVPFVDLGAGR